MRLIAIAPLALLASSCADPGDHPTPEEALLLEAQEAVRAELKDPDSAKFGKLDAAVIVLPAIGAVCFGTVNAKNAFGGYTGPQKFFYQRGRGAVLSESGIDAWRPISDECEAELMREFNEPLPGEG